MVSITHVSGAQTMASVLTYSIVPVSPVRLWSLYWYTARELPKSDIMQVGLQLRHPTYQPPKLESGSCSPGQLTSDRRQKGEVERFDISSQGGRCLSHATRCQRSIND
jgi:hypothetical protein